MKKILTIFMCMAMFMCFMPSMAFAGTAVASTDVAKIGEEGYATLQAAVEAAEDGATIELLADIVGDGVVVPSGKVFTLDFKGFKYTVNANYAGSPGTETQCFQLLEDSTLTFKDGTIEADGPGIGMVVQNYSNLTLDNMKIDGSSLSQTNWYYTLSNNCGTVVLKNGTKIIEKNTPDGDKAIFAMDSCKFGSYDAPTVTVEAGVEITGKIEVSGGNLNIQGGTITGTITKSSGNVNITGGTFSSDPSAYVASGKSVYAVGGKYVVDSTGKAAAIGTTLYDTLGAAVDAAEDGATVTLQSNVTVNAMVTLNKNLIIDLNGKTLSSDTGNSIVQVIDEKTLTIDGTDTGSEVYGRINLGIANNNNGNAVLNGGKYSCTGGQTVLHINGTCLNSNVTISGATISSPSDNGIQLHGKGTFLIENSAITGATAVYIKAGILTIKNSTLKGTKTPVDYSYNGNGANATGDGMVVDECNYPGGSPTVNIESGSFTGTKNSIGYYEYTGNGTPLVKAKINITGGTFSSDPKEYVASGYEVKENASLYTVSRIQIPSAPSAPVVTPDPVANDKTSGTTTAKIEPTTVDGKTSATVDTKTANAIVDKAIENKSSEVVINASSSTPVTPSTTPVEAKVELPTAAVKDIVEKTDANIVVKTDAATIELDQTAAEAVADKAGEAEKVNLVVETKAEKEDQVVIELKIETASGNVTDFKGGNVKVTVNIPKALEGKKVVCVYVDENGNYTKMEGKLNNDGTYTFVTGHFSTYVVMTEEEAAAAIEAQKSSKIAAGVQATTLKVRSSAAKGKITVKWTKSKGFKVDYYQVFKATKKNGTFKYLAKTTKLQLVNKKGLKAGKTYYFKVRGVRVVDGAKIYTNWSKLAIRKAK